MSEKSCLVAFSRTLLPLDILGFSNRDEWFRKDAPVRLLCFRAVTNSGGAHHGGERRAILYSFVSRVMVLVPLSVSAVNATLSPNRTASKTRPSCTLKSCAAPVGED